MARERQVNPLETQIATHQLPFSPNDMWYLFLHMLRCREVCVPAADLLVPEHFNPVTEAPWAVLWAATLTQWRKHGQLTYTGIQYELQSRLAADPYAMLPEHQMHLLRPDGNGVLFGIFSVPPTELVPSLGSDLLKRLLQERAVLLPLRQRFQQGDGQSYATNLPAVLEEARRRVSRIDALGVLPVGAIMPEFGSPLPTPQEYFPTGIPFVDNYIKGQRPGDVNGILGVFGSGKTTHCVDLTLTLAKTYHELALAYGHKSKLSVFVTYEEDEDKLTPRIWARAAGIPRGTMEKMDWDALSKPGALKPYERDMFAASASQGGMVESESERYSNARRWYNDSFALMDLSGSVRFPNAGRGYVSELRATLEKLALTRGQEIGTVVIDYAKIMCRRYMADRNLGEEQLRSFLGKLGNDLRLEVAVPFQATVWLAHQFNAEQNKRKPTVLLSHEDASESKSFAENLATCMCLGVRDPATGCILVNWSKLRYGADNALQLPPAVVHNDWQFSRMVDVSTRFTLDRVTNRFVDPATAAQIGGLDEQPRTLRGPGISAVQAVLPSI